MATALQPEKILGQLAELWTELAHPEKGASTASGVLRACAMTLIVAAEDAADASAVGEELAQLIHEHPSRAIVLRPSEAGELSARVFAQCWMPFGSRQQICCEQIEITAAPEKLGEVPGVMLGLLAPDLPVVLWARGPRWFSAPHFEDLLTLTHKVILDSARFDKPQSAFALLEKLGAEGRTVADLAWARITGWREIIAHAFETPEELSAASAIQEAHVEYGGKTAPAEALYLGAWLKYGLPQAALSLDGVPGPAGVRGVKLGEFVFRLNGECTVEIQSPKGDHATMLSESTACHAIREELSITQRDPIFERIRQGMGKLAL